jgi:glycosyltransferase involved in cell wall biosynthesis
VNYKEFANSKHPRRYFIPCGIDFDFFSPEKELTKTQNNKIFFPADPLRKEKNACLLKSIEPKIKELYPNLQVEYGGDVLRKNMPSMMRASFIIVSIGKFESDGLVAKEAMALNIPLITTDVGNASFYVDNSSGILISPNPASLLSAITSICENRSSFVSGRTRLKALKIDSKSTAEKILSVYL